MTITILRPGTRILTVGSRGVRISSPGGAAAVSPGLATLISYYRLEEATGATRADSKGTNHLSVVRGTVSQAAGLQGSSSSTAGGGDNSVTSVGTGLFSIAVGASLSFSCWVYRTTNAAGNLRVAHNGANADAISGWSLLGGDTSLFCLMTDGTHGRVGPLGGTIAINAWYHCAVVINRAVNTATMCINGTPGAAGDISSLTGAITCARGFRLHDYDAGVGVGGLSWSGRIDEFGIWSKAFTQAEVTWLYNSGAGRDYAEI